MKFVDHAPEAVLAAAKEMLRRGLTEGTAGNISARQEDGTIVVTPTSVDYDLMEVDDLVVIDPEGNILQAKEGRTPTSEKYLHLACLNAFDDIGSVVHSHPIHATMFAVAPCRSRRASTSSPSSAGARSACRSTPRAGRAAWPRTW